MNQAMARCHNANCANPSVNPICQLFPNACYANDEARENSPLRPLAIIVPIHLAADLDAVRKPYRSRVPQRKHTNLRVSGTAA